MKKCIDSEQSTWGLACCAAQPAQDPLCKEPASHCINRAGASPVPMCVAVGSEQLLKNNYSEHE